MFYTSESLLEKQDIFSVFKNLLLHKSVFSIKNKLNKINKEYRISAILNLLVIYFCKLILILSMIILHIHESMNHRIAFLLLDVNFYLYSEVLFSLTSQLQP